MPPRPLVKLRMICLALPESKEVEAWGEPTFRGPKKMFAMYASAGSHHGGGRPAVWFKATCEDQGRMIELAPDCYFVPPYVGKSGWVGAWLDGVADWDELTEFLRDAYRSIAPKRLLAEPAGPPPERTAPAKPLKRAAKKHPPIKRKIAAGSKKTSSPRKPRR